MYSKILANEFRYPKNFNLKKYDADERFCFCEREYCKISFFIKKEAGDHLLETPLSKNQQCQELEDSYHITATVIDSKQLIRWLRGFGPDIWDIKNSYLALFEFIRA